MDNEQALIERFLGGDSRAFDTLTLKYQAQVRGILFKATGDEQITDDLAQEVFIKVYKNLHRFKGQSSFSTWLYRITTNILNSYFRKEKLRRFLPLGEQIVAEARVERGQNYRDELFAGLSRLSRQERQIVILRGLQELSVSEAAGILGTTENVIKVSYHNARKKLKRWLKDE
ncbi:RNA polymerase sigma factor [Candidatus Neomarinimicrobiota bacterium]